MPYFYLVFMKKSKIFVAATVVLFFANAQGQDYIHGQSGTSYQNIGNTSFGSDGSTYQSIGNTTFGSDGNSSQRIGNTNFNSDGSTLGLTQTP